MFVDVDKRIDEFNFIIGLFIEELVVILFLFFNVGEIGEGSWVGLGFREEISDEICNWEFFDVLL